MGKITIEDFDELSISVNKKDNKNKKKRKSTAYENVDYVKFEATFWFMFVAVLIAVLTIVVSYFEVNISDTIIGFVMLFLVAIIAFLGFWYRHQVKSFYEIDKSQENEQKNNSED